ncbi:Zinc-binding dehydrogenase [Leifsonia sp. 98AMF]|uniref:alcohol dehydrogenase catalytic domain-containing protein n=1 Tax=unclassified Leifsonia TaxID=2663824 RepID=UPI00087CFED1|nr:MULTISPECIES: alcohol dehydrogenase catalytic domain-containing protein [unclassified Leifsonia]SDH61246.1 Zinc-binding dehydrogenase [Leifsonia sp. 197AMF]SDI77910.1 Zinc-binding dehydrogenase [Leifsonia sp. 466MF]SDK08678.1 Zinc-binding dehydrogenase [Leifsonia sp. 157MF]SDN81326.1 Zinc-binding dehydrogenase [Leifsonia sp. 509MF]SEN26038.1 Zinc-binding dehydrogenase [Leifsonia sp. 467MF]
MKITGAVLHQIGLSRPYSQSQPLTVEELELDPPGPGEVLVRIEAAGLCHSDLSVVDGNRMRPVPMLLGHEAAGRVVELGDGVEDLKVGQRVVMAFLPRCGECANCLTEGRLPCIPGSAANNAGTLLSGERRLHADGDEVFHHLGVSGFASHAVIDRRSMVPVDDDIPPQIAAVLGCAVLTGGGAVLNAGKPHEGDTIVVVGLGGVGMAALITAVSLGLGEVIGIDAVPEKLERARELGATAAYTPQEAIERGVKAAVVVEAAGHPRAFETAIALTGVGGKTVTVGLPAPAAESIVKPLGVTAEARTIVGSYLGSAVPSRDIPTYAQLWREGRLPVDALVSSTITLEQVNQALDELADGHALRQIILFPEPDSSSTVEGSRE